MGIAGIPLAAAGADVIGNVVVVLATGHAGTFRVCPAVTSGACHGPSVPGAEVMAAANIKDRFMAALLSFGGAVVGRSLPL